MNVGVISVRYAKALLAYSIQQGVEDAVYDGMKQLVHTLQDVKELPIVLRNPHLKSAERVKLLCSVMPQLPIMERFAALIVKEEREDILVFIAYEYMNLYREAKGICAVRFITAAPVAPDFKAGLEQIVGNENKMKVEVEYIVDESIIGGFRMEVASRRIDASVEGQLRRIRKQLVKQNRKLV